MMWMPIRLVTEVFETQNGVPVVTETHEHKVLGEKQSVKRTEHYKMLKVGQQPAATFSLWYAEFLEANVTVGGRRFEPTQLICGGIRYQIERDYNEAGDDMVELNCTKIM